MPKNWKHTVKELANRVGVPEARRLLVMAGVSSSTAEKLTRESGYPSKVGALLAAAIQRAVEASKQKAS